VKSSFFFEKTILLRVSDDITAACVASSACHGSVKTWKLCAIFHLNSHDILSHNTKH